MRGMETRPPDLEFKRHKHIFLFSRANQVFFVGRSKHYFRSVLRIILRAIQRVSSSQFTRYSRITLALTVPLSVCVQSLYVHRIFITKEERASVIPDFQVFVAKTGVFTLFPFSGKKVLRSHRARASAPLPR